MLRRKVGFTLVETIVIISIMGALSLGVALGVNKQLSKARDTQRKLQLKALAKSLEEYYDSALCYPASIPECGQKLALNNATNSDTVPCDPQTNQNYRYVTDSTTCGTQFKLYAVLENKEDTDIRYLGCAYGCGPGCAYNYGTTSPNSRLDNCIAPITPTGSSTTLTPTPNLTNMPTITEGPSPTGAHDQQYVCAPGVGNDGHCTVFLFPEMSDCPKIWMNDPLCNNECNNNKLRCKNSKGKRP